MYVKQRMEPRYRWCVGGSPIRIENENENVTTIAIVVSFTYKFQLNRQFYRNW